MPARGTCVRHLAYCARKFKIAVHKAGSAAEGATLLEIQTATFIAAAKSSVVEEVLSDNDRRRLASSAAAKSSVVEEVLSDNDRRRLASSAAAKSSVVEEVLSDNDRRL